MGEHHHTVHPKLGEHYRYYIPVPYCTGTPYGKLGVNRLRSENTTGTCTTGTLYRTGTPQVGSYRYGTYRYRYLRWENLTGTGTYRYQTVHPKLGVKVGEH